MIGLIGWKRKSDVFLKAIAPAFMSAADQEQAARVGYSPPAWSCPPKHKFYFEVRVMISIHLAWACSKFHLSI
jgi:hypothetical protein